MPEETKKKVKEGYQTFKRGYQATQAPKNPTPPKGGTGLASKHTDGKRSVDRERGN